MSQNFDPTNTNASSSGASGGSGGASTGATDLGTTRASTDMTTGGPITGDAGTGGGGQGSSTGAATGLATHAQEYSQKIAEAANTAKTYVSDRVSVVGDRLKDLQNKDFTQVAEDAKQYARQNPGQALVISAAAGFLLGLLLRGTRR